MTLIQELVNTLMRVGSTFLEDTLNTQEKRFNKALRKKFREHFYNIRFTEHPRFIIGTEASLVFNTFYERSAARHSRFVIIPITKEEIIFSDATAFTIGLNDLPHQEDNHPALEEVIDKRIETIKEAFLAFSPELQECFK